MVLLVLGLPKDSGDQEHVTFVVSKQYHEIYINIYVYIY